MFVYTVRFSFRDLFFSAVCVAVAVFLFSGLKWHKDSFKVKWIFDSDNRIALLSNGRYVQVDDGIFVGDVISPSGEKISSGGIFSFFERERFEIAKKIEEEFEYPVSSLIEAVTLGVRYNLPEGLKTYMLLTGTYPFIAVSGLHTGIVFGLLMLLFFPLSKEKRFTLSAAVLTVLLPFTGLPVSVLRAYFFIVFVGFLKLYGRKVDYLYVLLLTAFLLSFSEISTGFILSFLAVAGIAIGMDKGIKGRIFAGTFPFLFTAPYVVYKFKVINLFAPVSIFLLSLLFSAFLLFSFLSEITFFKIELINSLTFKLGELFILGVKKLFVPFSAGVVYSAPPSGWIFLITFTVFILVVFAIKKEFIFVALSIFLLSLPLFREFKSGEVLTIKGKSLNSAYFIAGDGQQLRNCLIKTDYVFPFAENVLEMKGNRIIIEK
ncbi:ComEC/Rec2 family competence protein [Desulfurobacterium atlanticum]|uniref:ComEC/Rec2 family competence protein n=1 Tax=Desulfurobacterium atlanticum TaxID=240169 RepID=UPI0015DA0F52|nr:ComEC/Rec2 family competence protein [Desulfurobacterium atlanticum]